ncbi:hypothetical protein SKAU_G00426350 [Synaphobranchus kaupii]|uniref:CCHC-type domain-containing protein n=1 Tax=Synaphobranchus kaupii TaxID=118154 RepID=A0A9Q1IAG3_SYNKA|nr:hypothetical protein SKAU_G00426350 [Synaphobranchus kaupii]
MPGQDELESVEEEVSLFPARRQFRHLTKEQLEGLAEEHEVMVPDNTKKPALIKLLMAELELEDIWAGEEKREAREAEQAEREAEQAEREAERSSRIQLAKLEVERAKAVHGPALTSRFDVSQARHFMPKFREEDADTFFEAFEIVAREMEWPDAKWALLVQSSLAGKAQVAFAALDPRVGLNYEELKKAVLAAYGGVPESYRQRFRNLKRRNGESYLDVGRRLSIAFDRWLAAGKVFDYSELRELMLVEQFKNSVPREVEVYLSERQVNKLVEASQMADAFEVIHAEPSGKSRPNGGCHDGHRNQEVSGGGRPPPNKANLGERPPSRWSAPDGRSGPGFDSRSDIVCHYCHERGHVKSRCPVLAKKEGRDKAVALVMSSTGGSVVPPPVYDAFTSAGTVSVSQGTVEVPVTILRDTGAAQSLLLQGVLDLPASTYQQASALIEGLGGEYGVVPLHTVYLRSNVVSGLVTVGVVMSLPVKGIRLLLGNDLAGSQVCVTPVVSSVPRETPETQALEKEYPEVFTACVVTRSQTRAWKSSPAISEEVVVCPDSVTPPAGVPEPEAPPVDLEESVELADTVFARAVGMSEPSHFTREALVREQHQDGTLAALWKEAVTEEESQDVAAGVYVQDDVLMLVSPQSEDEGENLYTPPEPVSARVENTRALEQLGKQLSHLTTVQRQDVLELVASHPVLFKDRPGLTPLAIHDVETASAEAIKQHPYRFPPRKKKQVAEEAFRCPMPECFAGG